MSEPVRLGFGHSAAGQAPSHKLELPDCPARHCWVHAPHLSGRIPGLLVEWRGRGGAWEGRVIHAWPVDGRWVTVESWLPAAHVSPR